jgi:LysM repeat protein
MSVKIGHASIDENRKANGGTAGDQTKKEVCTRTWYSYPWTSVIRPKDVNVAEKIAKAMEQACANDKIGYDQYQRTTLYTLAKANNWDLSKITTACECDCSSLVAVCVNAAGIPVSKDIYTGNEKAALNATGKFTIYTDFKYTGSSNYLNRGDILLGNGHTAIVLSDGPYTVDNVQPESSVSSNVADTVYTVQAGDSLSKIATKYNTTYQKLAEYNNISNPNIIRVGQKIKIPGAKVHVVQRGETLSGIAAKYKTTYQILAKYNNISNPNIISVGQKIKIPN